MLKDLAILAGCMTVSYFLFGKKKEATPNKNTAILLPEGTFDNTNSENRLMSMATVEGGNCRIYQSADGTYHYNAYGTPIPKGATCQAVFNN